MLALAMASLVLASQSGCGRADHWPLPPPPSEEVRSNLGRIVVRTDDDALAASALAPAISGACSAAGCGVLMGLSFGLGASAAMFGSLRGTGGGGSAGAFIFAIVFLFFAAISAALITLGLVGGALWGLSKTPSGKALEEARQKIEQSVRANGLSRRIGRRVVDWAARDTDVLVTSWSPGAPVDTYLDISGPCLTMTGPFRFDGPLRLLSEVRVRLVSARDGSMLHAFSLGHVGRERTFEQWAEGNGAAVVDEQGDANRFAERILEEIFLLDVLPPAEPPPASRARP